MPKKKSIQYVIFDWGGTLGQAGRRWKFLHSRTNNERFKALKPDTINILKYLKKKGYRMAIVSNTGWPRHEMDIALKTSGLDKFFDFAVYSNDSGMCSKPCDLIYQTAVELCKRFIPIISREEMLYVGDNFGADVLGSRNHMLSCYITNGSRISKLIDQFNVTTQSDFVIDRLRDIKKFL